MCGGGVAIGDANGDGLADVYLTRPTGGCRFYQNLGGFKFKDVTAASGLEDEGAWGLGASFADIDNDGDLDLYVCGFACPNRLFINDGSGKFQEKAAEFGLSFSGASVMMAFADYDNDGDLDGYLLTNRIDPPADMRGKGRAAKINGKWHVPEEYLEYSDVLVKPDGNPHVIQAGQYDHLFRNDGGKFVDASGEAGIHGNHFGLSATWWDYNNDGLPDLYVANDFYGPDHLYRNDGDGTFTDVARDALPHTPWFSMGSDAADINNDGLIDFVASDMSGTNHYRQKMAMGEMSENAWFLTSAEPRQYMRNAVFINTGSDRFMEAAYLTGLANSNWTWSMKFADFDCDGRVDLFVSNGMTRDWFNSDLRARSLAMGGFGDPRWRDFWMAQPPLKEQNLAFQNKGNMQFESVGEPWGLNLNSVSFGAALGDFDGDGDLDLIVNNFQETPAVYRNQATANRVVILLRGTTSNRFGIGASVRIETDSGIQVRQMFPARGFMSCDENAIHFGLGSDEAITRMTVTWPSGMIQEFRDIAANQTITVTEREQGSEESVASDPDPSPSLFVVASQFNVGSHKETPFDDFALQPLLPRKLSQLGPRIAVGDIDADGDPDLYIGGAADHSGQICRNDGGGKFSSLASPWDQMSEDTDAAFFDADGDGDLDLYVVSGGVECNPDSELLRDRLYLNTGDGAFTKSTKALPDLRDSGGTIAIADIDHDGDTDLFIGGRVIPGQYPLAPRSRILLNKGGKFRDATVEVSEGLSLTGLVTDAIWSDIDGDGWLDLLVTHEWGPVKVWKNTEGRLTELPQPEIGNLTGWWNSITAGDIDHDGDPDFAVMNFGLNTKYQTSIEKPAQLFFGDFDGSGTMRLIEAAFESEILFPVRGRSCTTSAIPSLAARFNDFDSFARASLSEIYPAAQLERAHQFRANTLESGILVNDGLGQLTFRPLPRLAQIAPAFGAAFADVDSDGILDLYIVQNFFGPEPETGHMDGGVSLLLKGDGLGEFEPMWPNESGLIVSGDAKDVAADDFDGNGSVDFVVSVNDGNPLLFLNQTKPAR